MQDLFTWLEEHREPFKSLPDPDELHKVGKAWLCNVLATVLPEEFPAYVEACMNARQKKQVHRQNKEVSRPQ